MTWRPFAIALLLPILFTATVLFEVGRNRAGGRGPTILTDQDVTLEGATDENSGARVWLSWSTPEQADGPWLDCAKIAALGFDCSVGAASRDSDRHYARQLPRYAYVAFAFDESRATRSRLIPVDVDRDPDALARRYPDSRTHLISPALVSVRRFIPPASPPYVSAMLVTIDPRGIQIPTELRRSMPPRAAGGRTPPMQVTIRYGRSWVPWVEAVATR
jgi:hypothetical protein